MSTPGFSHIHIRITQAPFNQIYAAPDGITIDAVYDNGFDYDFIEAAGEPYDDITVMETYHALTQDASNVTHLHRGDVLSICGLTFSVLNAYDDTVLQNVGDEKDYQNNASLLLKVSSVNSSMLFCSDIKYDMNDSLLAACKDQLACDYVQTGHHGNWSFSEEFYDAAGRLRLFYRRAFLHHRQRRLSGEHTQIRPARKGKTVLDFSTAPNTVTLK